MNRTLLAVVMLAACTPGKVAPSYKLDASDCDAACVNLELLGCRTSSGKLLSKLEPDKTCTQACFDKISQGVDLHPTCVANAKTCDAVNSCSRE